MTGGLGWGVGGKLKREGARVCVCMCVCVCVCVCVADSLCCTAETNIVKQLLAKKEIKRGCNSNGKQGQIQML